MQILKKYNFIFYFCYFLIILGLFCSLYFLKINIWWKILATPLIIWLGKFLLGLRVDFFKHVLPEEVKEKIGFYKLKWRSNEFDEFVGQDLIQLRKDSNNLLKEANESTTYISDYSYIVFPMAKAYEGILKKVLVEAQLVKEEDIQYDPNVPINNYFNPVSNTTIFNLLADKVRDKSIPHTIYATYQECRNQILHYDSYRDNRLTSLNEVEFYLMRLDDAAQKAVDTFKNKKINK